MLSFLLMSHTSNGKNRVSPLNLLWATRPERHPGELQFETAGTAPASVLPGCAHSSQTPKTSTAGQNQSRAVSRHLRVAMSLSAEAPSMAVLTNLGSAGQGGSGSTGDGFGSPACTPVTTSVEELGWSLAKLIQKLVCLQPPEIHWTCLDY